MLNSPKNRRISCDENSSPSLWHRVISFSDHDERIFFYMLTNAVAIEILFFFHSNASFSKLVSKFSSTRRRGVRGLGATQARRQMFILLMTQARRRMSACY